MKELDGVFFITLPDDFALSEHAMRIDRTIPLPVQKKEGNADDTEGFDLATLEPEQILSGILTVLAYDTGNKHADYYRSILMEARPNIKVELSEAAILKTKNEDYDLAEEIFMALKGLDPADTAIILNCALFFDQRADNYRRSRLYDDADAYDALAGEHYKRAMEAEPPVPDTFFNAGFFYLKQYNFSLARECFEAYIALTCDISDEELGENGIYKKERAQQILNNIKTQNIDDERFKKAYRLLSEGDAESALDEIRAFLQSNSYVWNAWFMLGWALRSLERYADAKKAFEKALELGGQENCDTYNELSICLTELGDLAEAQRNLEIALSLEPESTKVISNLGFLALKRGDANEAKKYFETVLEFDPQDRIAAEQLARL